jgi:histidyl-tRNA synthetase
MLTTGGAELIEKLLQDAKLTASARAKQGLEEMKVLFSYLEVFAVTKHVRLVVFMAFPDARCRLI